MRQFAGYSPACEIARNALAAVKKSAKLHRAAGAELGRSCSRIQACGDDAENALRADQQPVGAWPGARAGQPPRLDHALRA